MRSYQLFASMSAERAAQMLEPLALQVPSVFAQAIAAANAALKARPVYLLRQPFAKRDPSAASEGICATHLAELEQATLPIRFLSRVIARIVRCPRHENCFEVTILSVYPLGSRGYSWLATKTIKTSAWVSSGSSPLYPKPC